MKAQLTEDYMVEQAAISWLKELGYSYVHGSELSPENGERPSYRHTVLKRRFTDAIMRLNTWLTPAHAEKVYEKVVDLEHPELVMKSKLFYEMLVGGVKLKVREKGEEKTRLVQLVDFESPSSNELLVANQFTVEYQYESGSHRRPDIVVFINGLPIAVFELKSFNANETARDAYSDHVVKMEDIPQLYTYAQVLVASDGAETKYGSITSSWDRFFVWEGIFDEDDLEVRELEEGISHYTFKKTKEQMTSLEVLIKGLFRHEHILEYIQDFVIYEKAGDGYTKKIAMFHQFYAVRKAVERTRKAVAEGKTPDDKRVGVVWHTQGSGKSLTMLFYARKTLKAPELENPLLLFITDRMDLDEQLHGIFANALPMVKQAESIKDLQETIKHSAGGIVFATIQKFGKRKADEYPLLSERHNIVVIADEAHRSQYRGLAQNLRRAIPNASFMGFTATPIELQDRSTTLVFGEPISIYSMDVARRHGVVVPIYYEARLSKLHLTNEFIDEQFEEISDSVAADPDTKEALKKKFARLENLIMAEERLDSLARDIVNHFNSRTQEIMGKAMVVTISRKVAVKLYEKITSQPDAPSVAVVISGSKQKDPEEFWQHLRNKRELEELADRFKNPEDGLQMVIVVDMWLTGFDVPCLHTMYFDKPMKNHSLVQAIARVNRVFKDKPGGLIIDYIGIADDLRISLSYYTLNAVRETLHDINEVIGLLKEKHDILTSFFYGMDYEGWKILTEEELSRLTILAYERVAKDEETKKKFVRNFVALKKLYALASPHPEASRIKDDIMFFEMIKKMIVKYSTAKVREIHRDLEYEMRQLISKSIAAEEPVDVFALRGKEQPDISIFDENFLANFRKMEQKSYAADLLAKIIKDQLVVKMKSNPIRYRSLYERLKELTDRYNVKLIDAADVIDELINLANDIKKAVEEGKNIKISEEELAFYDLLSSKEKLFENYQEIEEVAKEVVRELGYYIKVADWNKKEHIKARIKAAIKKILMRVVDGRASYRDIERLSADIITHAEAMYAEA